MENKEDIVVETTYVDSHAKNLFYELPSGKKCYIGPYDQDFFFKLQKFPAETKIRMMKLSVYELEKYITEEKKSANDRLMSILNRTWYYRDTGDVAQLMAGDIDGTKYSVDELKARCNSKRKLPLKEITDIIEFFVGGRSEFYFIDDETGEKIFPS